MAVSLLSWLLAGVLVVTCLAAARSAWNLGERAPGISRMALLSSVLDAAAVAAFFRLVVAWSTGTTLLWVVAMAALAAAVAGAVIRWPQLPSHAALLDFTEPDTEQEQEPATTPPGQDELRNTGPLGTKSRGKSRGKPKKEPGRRAVAVRAVVLAAVVAFSFAVG